MKIIGITGTNGKTTTAWFLREILEKAGYQVGMIGTLTGRLTTPSPWELTELFNKFRAEKKDYVVMEVSSHGIHQDRIKGLFFHVKLLTNITRDHLDYHKTFRAYKKVKLKWLLRGAGIKIYPADFKKQKIDFAHDFVGGFNEKNIKATLAVVDALGISRPKAIAALKHVSQVPGRFENIKSGQQFKVIVDYAHTPDGLENILAVAKALKKKSKRKNKNKIITVFGCGGDRDKGKRPLMGRLVFKYSDLTIVTSDNPRTENAEQIIKEIMGGIKPCFWQKNKRILIEKDRAQAIKKAISLAGAADVVILAGKGHETYQIIGEKRIHFDDREEARKALANMGYR